MNITIFGASGKTGQVILGKALSLGHQVTAYVRRPFGFLNNCHY